MPCRATDVCVCEWACPRRATDVCACEWACLLLQPSCIVTSGHDQHSLMCPAPHFRVQGHGPWPGVLGARWPPSAGRGRAAPAPQQPLPTCRSGAHSPSMPRCLKRRSGAHSPSTTATCRSGAHSPSKPRCPKRRSGAHSLKERQNPISLETNLHSAPRKLRV